jgi:hypothetical protein
VDDTHFRYSIGLPADSYDLMYEFGVKSSGTIPSVATRIGQEHLTISSSLKHDVTLPAIDVATYTVTLTGTDALPSNGSSFGRFIEVILVNSSNTLMVTGLSPTGGHLPMPMWVPRETITPFFMVQMSPVPTAPYTSGSVNQFKLDPITPTGDFSLAQPPFVKISGTISDPYQNLTPVLGIGGLGTSGISHYQCAPLAPASYPDSIFSYPEGSTSDFFTDSPSLAFYPRKGLTCVPYANYAIATGSQGRHANHRWREHLCLHGRSDGQVPQCHHLDRGYHPQCCCARSGAAGHGHRHGQGRARRGYPQCSPQLQLAQPGDGHRGG